MIPTAVATAIFAKDAEFSQIKIKVEQCHRTYACIPSGRGRITGFSNKSRKRLFDLLSQVPRTAFSGGLLFVTLTYPNEFPTDYKEYKAHLRAFLKRLYRKAREELPVLWRLEFQKRGAPHFHLIVWGINRLDLQWLSQAWYSVVGSGDEKHLLAGTNVKYIRDRRLVLSYVSKYLAKGMKSPCDMAGRVWGIWKKSLLGIVIVEAQISVSWAIEIRQEMLEYLERRGINVEKFVMYGIRSMTCYGFPLKSILEGGT